MQEFASAAVRCLLGPLEMAWLPPGSSTCGVQGGGLSGSTFMPRPHKKRRTGDDSSDEDEWKPSSHSVLKAVRALSGMP